MMDLSRATHTELFAVRGLDFYQSRSLQVRAGGTTKHLALTLIVVTRCWVLTQCQIASGKSSADCWPCIGVEGRDGHYRHFTCFFTLSGFPSLSSCAMVHVSLLAHCFMANRPKCNLPPEHLTACLVFQGVSQNQEGGEVTVAWTHCCDTLFC